MHGSGILIANLPVAAGQQSPGPIIVPGDQRHRWTQRVAGLLVLRNTNTLYLPVALGFKLFTVLPRP